MLACHVPTARQAKGVNAKLASVRVARDAANFSLVVPLTAFLVFPHEADHLHLRPGMQRYERASSA